MSWIETVNRDILPIIAPFAPRGFKSFNPYKLSKKLGDTYDYDKWKKVLRAYRIDLKEYELEEVSAEFDDSKNRIRVLVSNKSTKFSLIQTIIHEMIHVNQFAISKEQYYKLIGPTSVDEMIKYYSYFGEIQAFAHCIFLELQDEGHIHTDTMDRYLLSDPIVRQELLIQIHRHINRYTVNGIIVPVTL